MVACVRVWQEGGAKSTGWTYLSKAEPAGFTNSRSWGAEKKEKDSECNDVGPSDSLGEW